MMIFHYYEKWKKYSITSCAGVTLDMIFFV